MPFDTKMRILNLFAYSGLILTAFLGLFFIGSKLDFEILGYGKYSGVILKLLLSAFDVGLFYYLMKKSKEFPIFGKVLSGISGWIMVLAVLLIFKLI